MECRFCGSNHVIKHGKTNAGTQRYKCKTCGERFVVVNATDQRVKVNSEMAQALRDDGKSYREIGAELKVNHQTAVNLQLDEPCVYIVKVGSLYKIGKTRNIEQRLSALSSEHKYPCVLIAKRKCDHNVVEKKMHDMFQEWRVGGELFNFDNNLLDVAMWMLRRL